MKDVNVKATNIEKQIRNWAANNCEGALADGDGIVLCTRTFDYLIELTDKLVQCSATVSDVEDDSPEVIYSGAPTWRRSW